MKVLLVNKYHYIRGGSETYYFGLAELLRHTGHEVIFFAMQDDRNLPCEQEKYFISHVDFNTKLGVLGKIKAGLHMVYSLEARTKMEQLLRKEQPDIIHINLFHRVFTASILGAAKRFGIPVVFTMHDLNCICPNHTMLDHGKLCEACLSGRYFHCVTRKCFKDSRFKCLMAAIESKFNRISGAYNKINLYVTPSEFYQKMLAEAHITRSPIVHMRNFLPENQQYEAHTEHSGYYLYFGRLTPEKGIMTVLKAFSRLRGVRLYIAGSGEQEEELRLYVKDRSLEDRVSFLGFLSGSALTKTVQNAKCIILASEWYENGPYAIMEAMACGKPVIVSSLGGLSEIVTDNATGFVCRAFDDAHLAESVLKVESLAPGEYLNMSLFAAEQAQKLFAAQQYSDQLLAAYGELLQADAQARLSGKERSQANESATGGLV